MNCRFWTFHKGKTMIAKQQRGTYQMLIIKKSFLIPAGALAVFVLGVAPAYAYLDPGTGSMIVQSIAAIVLTAGAMAGVFWKAIKNFFLHMGKQRKNGFAINDQPASGNQAEKKDIGRNSHND